MNMAEHIPTEPGTSKSPNVMISRATVPKKRNMPVSGKGIGVRFWTPTKAGGLGGSDGGETGAASRHLGARGLPSAPNRPELTVRVTRR